jgi:predicted aldo/keto reductase-like oxidoreductase
MRFAKKGPSFDEEEIERELLHAIDMGINYYDMAYIYPGIEDVFGRIMEKCGFRREGILRSRMINKGEAIDVALYAILRKEILPDASRSQ